VHARDEDKFLSFGPFSEIPFSIYTLFLSEKKTNDITKVQIYGSTAI